LSDRPTHRPTDRPTHRLPYLILVVPIAHPYLSKVDNGATHFWQFVSQGRKRWRVWQTDPLADWVRFQGVPFSSPSPSPSASRSWKTVFFPDVRCSGVFGEEAMAAANAATDGACGGGGASGSTTDGPSSSSQASSSSSWPLPDPFDDLALEAWLRRLTVEGAEDTSSSSSSSTTSSSGLLNVNKMVVHETVVTAGEIIVIPANAPHAVLQPGSSDGFGDEGEGESGGDKDDDDDDDDDDGITVAVSVNFVDATNVVEARDAALASPVFHGKFRSRLRKFELSPPQQQQHGGGEEKGGGTPVAVSSDGSTDGSGGGGGGGVGASSPAASAEAAKAAVAAAAAAAASGEAAMAVVPASRARWYEQHRMAAMDEPTSRLVQLASVPADELKAALVRAGGGGAYGGGGGAISARYFQVPWAEVAEHRLTHEQVRLANGQVR
jgi:hypothetical protein